jgi:hypothetical protein
VSDGPINRAEAFRDLERLESKIAFLERHQLPNAHLRGGLSQERKVRAQIERLESEAARLYGQLHEAVTLDDYESLDDGLLCSYCGPSYRFADRHAAFKAWGICPRCDPTSPGVSPYDPNWHPDKDRR